MSRFLGDIQAEHDLEELERAERRVQQLQEALDEFRDEPDSFEPEDWDVDDDEWEWIPGDTDEELSERRETILLALLGEAEELVEFERYLHEERCESGAYDPPDMGYMEDEDYY